MVHVHVSDHAGMFSCMAWLFQSALIESEDVKRNQLILQKMTGI